MWHYFNGATLTHLDILRANGLRKNLKRGRSKSKLERKSASSDRVLVNDYSIKYYQFTFNPPSVDVCLRDD